MRPSPPSSPSPPAGLVLRSPFTSLADAASVHYWFLPIGLLLRDRFEVVEYVAAVEVPVIVVLGSAACATAAESGGR